MVTWTVHSVCRLEIGVRFQEVARDFSLFFATTSWPVTSVQCRMSKSAVLVPLCAAVTWPGTPSPFKPKYLVHVSIMIWTDYTPTAFTRKLVETFACDKTNWAGEYSREMAGRPDGNRRFEKSYQQHPWEFFPWHWYSANHFSFASYLTPQAVSASERQYVAIMNSGVFSSSH